MITRREFSALALQPLLRAASGRIRAGCQTRCYGNPPATLEALLPLLDDMKAAGYEGFETNNGILKSLPNPAAVEPELRRRVPLIGLHLGLRWSGEDMEKIAIAEIERVAAAVKQLGGTHLFLSGAARKEVWTNRVAALRHGASVCHRLGIVLAVHNHQEETRDNFAELRFLLDNLRPLEMSIILDIGHAALAGADAAGFLRSNAARVAGLHVRDRIGDRQVPMGTGQVDLAGTAKAIRDTGWSGWITAELEGTPIPGVSAKENVRAARKYLRERMGA